MAKEQLTPEQLQSLSARINDLFATTNIDDVSAESAGFSEAPDGYFLCEVKQDELTLSKNTGNPQVAFQFKIVEDGRAIEDVNKTLDKTKGITIFKYYRLVDEKDVRKFVSDMMKFEVDDNGTSLPKEAFTNDGTIHDALEIINGLQIYVQVSSTTKEDGSKSTFYNLVTWKRAVELGLPC